MQLSKAGYLNVTASLISNSEWDIDNYINLTAIFRGLMNKVCAYIAKIFTFVAVVLIIIKHDLLHRVFNFFRFHVITK